MTGKTGTKLDKQNMDSGTRLQTLLIDSPVGAVLPAIALLNLPNCGWQVMRCEISRYCCL